MLIRFVPSSTARRIFTSGTMRSAWSGRLISVSSLLKCTLQYYQSGHVPSMTPLEPETKGHIVPNTRAFTLRYAKSSSLRLVQKMYYADDVPRLNRKYRKVQNILTTNRKHARVLELVDRPA